MSTPDVRPAPYTDEWLDEQSASTTPGPSNRARHLRQLDTPERRSRADSEAMTLTNIRGGRPSDNVADAARALLRMIEEGREGEEMYGELYARRERERQQEHQRIAMRAEAARYHAQR